MSSRRQTLLARVNWYLQSSLNILLNKSQVIKFILEVVVTDMFHCITQNIVTSSVEYKQSKWHLVLMCEDRAVERHLWICLKNKIMHVLLQYREIKTHTETHTHKNLSWAYNSPPLLSIHYFLCLKFKAAGMTHLAIFHITHIKWSIDSFN